MENMMSTVEDRRETNKTFPVSSLQIVHMGWACESPEGGAAGRTSAFKFLALRGPYFYIFRNPPVISPVFSSFRKLYISPLDLCKSF